MLDVNTQNELQVEIDAIGMKIHEIESAKDTLEKHGLKPTSRHQALLDWYQDREREILRAFYAVEMAKPDEPTFEGFFEGDCHKPEG